MPINSAKALKFSNYQSFKASSLKGNSPDSTSLKALHILPKTFMGPASICSLPPVEADFPLKRFKKLDISAVTRPLTDSSRSCTFGGKDEQPSSHTTVHSMSSISKYTKYYDT